jgi:hypothetical protein
MTDLPTLFFVPDASIVIIVIPNGIDSFKLTRIIFTTILVMHDTIKCV